MIVTESLNKNLNKILLNVEKPARYVGGEHNQVMKPWHDVKTHVALVFPDIYDIGAPNLGLAILYDGINQRADALAERAYLPWTDMEMQLRQAGLPLFSLESKHALTDFDILGIHLPYETLYTNALNLLDLAHIPLASAERNAAHPLVIAGGQACFNPEPMAAFIDAFVIGEGEEAIHEVIQIHQQWQNSGSNREALLLALAQIPGVYVPSLYTVNYNTDQTIAEITPRHPQVPAVINKRVCATLPAPVTNLLVPNVKVVHERIAMEIMRGCTRGCRYCHAGSVNRPIRERPVDEIIQALHQAVKATGYEEIGLLSLSSSDYSQILPLIERMQAEFSGKGLSIALPSLRIESFSLELMNRLKGLHPGGGFTLAPEAATERMRAIINKPLEQQTLMDTVEAIYSGGWNNLKLYFMIGLPFEELEDVEAIVTMCKNIAWMGKKIAGGKANLHASIGTFIPKPHTAFQWSPVNHPDLTREKLKILKDGFYKSRVKLSYNKPESTLLEAWLSRGDRRLSAVILRAWQLGAKFDAWMEHFNPEIWQQAFAECGIDPDFYAYHDRPTTETMPWQHIHSGIKPSLLKEDFEWAKAGKTRNDCRAGCYACGIQTMFADLIKQTSPDWYCP